MTKKDAKELVKCIEQVPEVQRTELQRQQLEKLRKVAGGRPKDKELSKSSRQKLDNFERAVKENETEYARPEEEQKAAEFYKEARLALVARIVYLEKYESKAKGGKK